MMMTMEDDSSLDNSYFSIENNEENEIPGTPPELRAIANKCTGNLLPDKSKMIYKQTYQKFMEWRQLKNANSFSENILLAYFMELAGNMKPSTLWKTYSMLRSTIGIEHNINIADYARLHAFLKKGSNGFQAKKSNTLSADEVKRFIKEAPDDVYLGTKVAVIIGVMGACRKNEMYTMKIQDIQDLGNAVLISVPDTKTKICRKFTITGEFYDIFKKYFRLRPANSKVDNFFLNYQKGRCTNQIMGINKLGGMPKQVATFLGLSNPNSYTGHCFRRTSATMLIDAGANIETLKRHGGWKSTEVAEGYIDNSINNRINIANKILTHLDIQSGQPPFASNVNSSLEVPAYASSSSYVAATNKSSNCNLPNLTFNNCTNISNKITSQSKQEDD